MSTRHTATEALREAAAALLGFGSGGGSGTPSNPFWLVPNWYVDPANSTGHASDANSGTSPTAPFLHYAEVLNRLGTTEPILAQNTVIHFLSDHANDFSDPVILHPYTVNNAITGIQGLLIDTGVGGVLGPVTPKNRAAGQALQANIGTPAAAQVGFIISNTTKGSRAWVDEAVAGNVAQLTQPLASTTSVLPTLFPTNPAADDTWAPGDAFRILRPVKVNLFEFVPSTGEDTGAVGTNFIFGWIQQIWGIDPSTSGPSSSTVALKPNTYISESRFDRFIGGNNLPGDTELLFDNCWLPGSGAFYAAGFNGGSINSLNIFDPSVNVGSLLDGDVIIHGFLDNGNIIPSVNYLASAYIRAGGTVIARYSGVFRVTAGGYGAGVLWGPGNVEAAVGGGITFDGTAVAQLLLTGTKRLDGGTIGITKNIVTGAEVDNVTITPATIDAAPGSSIFNPQTGSRFAKYNV